MPSILNEADKETVKRTVPKASNKIQAVAVAKLYVAHPNRNQWTYTGLQGAAVLSNDLVGNTFWIKLVDISPSNRGVIWDQEIYDTFQYNQDRTFFHSFELEQCTAGLSFMDEKEAKQFKKKMDERENNASKATKAQPFGSNNAGGQIATQNGGSHHKSGGMLGKLFRSHRNVSNPTPQPQSIIPAPQPVYSTVPSASNRPVSSKGADSINFADPSWQPMLDELLAMGITEDLIASNADFIKSYIEQKQREQIASGLDSISSSSRSKAAHPPPPPPPSGPPAVRISSEDTGSSGRRGPPPAPPPSRRPVGGRASSPPRPSSPERTPSPAPSSQPRFRAPPPLADAGKFAVKEGPAIHPSGRDRSSSLTNPGPPPPPRPPKTPIEDDEDEPPPGFRVPPPFTGSRGPVPPPPPSRGQVPPPPPSRNPVPPLLPPKADAPTSIPLPPPPPPGRSAAPPLPPPSNRAVPPPPSASVPPPPPPPPPMPGLGGPPPPPPMPSSAGPPPPPPPPGAGSAPPLPKPAGDRNDLLSAIRGSGGKGGGGLRKVPDSEKRVRDAAVVPGSEHATSAVPTSASEPAVGGDAQGGLAGALAVALQKRKQKVSGSDDEKDDDDDW